jgi:4-oxalocrotonate tautomerase
MPIAIVHMMEGRDEEKKARAIAAITQAIAETLDAKPETVRVILQEAPETQWGIAGKPAAERT